MRSVAEHLRLCTCREPAMQSESFSSSGIFALSFRVGDSRHVFFLIGACH